MHRLLIAASVETAFTETLTSSYSIASGARDPRFSPPLVSAASAGLHVSIGCRQSFVRLLLTMFPSPSAASRPPLRPSATNDKNPRDLPRSSCEVLFAILVEGLAMKTPALLTRIYSSNARQPCPKCVRRLRAVCPLVTRIAGIVRSRASNETGITLIAEWSDGFASLRGLLPRDASVIREEDFSRVIPCSLFFMVEG